jgi:hypothetical protein
LLTYDLGTQGNITRIKASLENREIIDLWGDKIEFIDPLFSLWFNAIYLGEKLKGSKIRTSIPGKLICLNCD